MKQALIPAMLMLSSAAAAAPLAKPVTLSSNNSLLEWEVSWPAEVSAIPVLQSWVRADALKNKAKLLKFAAEDRAERKKGGYPFNAYDSSTGYEVAGETPRLLSLTISWGEFTGGAHPNHGTKGLLWDRSANRRINVYSLLTGDEAAFGTLTRAAFCAALAKERKERREGEDANTDASDPFNQCPALKELAIIPQASKGGKTFSSILFHADPYVAGPYVEGDYDIELPVTAAFVAALKPEFRPSFAAKP